ncbi:Urease accessory UreD 2 [Gossypium arboreum]|uniref:Urease accessory UreD 2 n=1 Tax=Gossypium arboreum TaxID=29729 RepID=A0A0B0NVK4_GOSAR|nr:Urease accessory UreD 2 [Gossypium arboreum]
MGCSHKLSGIRRTQDYLATSRTRIRPAPETQLHVSHSSCTQTNSMSLDATYISQTQTNSMR